MKKLYLILAILLFTNVHAAEISTIVKSTQGDKKPLGQVIFRDTPYGLLIIPNLQDLPPGLHGFHIHQNPSCKDHGQGAGGHFDPQNTHSHQGPYGKGHLGDLPALYVNAAGEATLPTLAPRLKTSDLKNVSLMIHKGGDTYSDTPKLGGGGARIACGVIKSN